MPARFILLALLAASLALPSRAEGQGTAAGSFLRLGAGARAASLGNAYTGLATDATAVYWNPAALTRLRTKSVVLMRGSYVGNEYSYDYAGWGGRLNERWAAGAAIQHVSVGGLPRTDVNGVADGEFKPRDLAVSAAVARLFGKHSLGLVGKYVSSKITKTASTATGGVSYLSPALARSRLRLGFTADNLFGRLKYVEESQPLPRVWRGGFALRITDDWLVAADAEQAKGARTTAGAGAEYRRAFNEDAWTGALRGGYTTRGQDLGGLGGFTLGLGALWKRVSFDYAFVPDGDLGYTHLVSLGFWFSPPDGSTGKAPSRSTPSPSIGRGRYILK